MVLYYTAKYVLLLTFSVILRIPLSEVSKAFAKCDFGGETEITLQRRRIGVRYGNVAWLHGDEFFVGLEVLNLKEETDMQNKYCPFFVATTDLIFETLTNSSDSSINISLCSFH